jgi:LCP family protein required for cell wall assembly
LHEAKRDPEVVGVSDEHNGENGFEPEDMEPEDERTENDEPDVPSGEGEGAPEPATFAGRRQWSGLPSSGLTEDFNEIESETAEGPDDAPEEDEPGGDTEDEQEDVDEGDAGEYASPVADGEEAEPEADEEPEAAEGDEPEDHKQAQAEAEEAKPEDEAEPAEPVESGATIEANKPALADQEEAREQAMAGLRERTQMGQAKRGVSEPEGSEDATEVPEPSADGEEQPEPEAPALAGVVAVADLPADQRKPPKSWLWTRFVTASFLIIVSMATATSVSLLVYLTDIAKGLGGLEGLSDQLDSIDEEAQNFLILGSDVRPDEPGHGRSDTTMLLRVDPDHEVISQLSIPRDLKVYIPRHGGPYKFNEAYSYGGPKLTLKTLNALTGDRIPIQHVVNVDFTGFADAVDAIGCVYVDVDRHYYVSPEEDYAEIDIEAGYQRLCGLKALQYVRFRHADNDLVRSARQQGFLREARSQVPPGKLLEQRNKLIDIFTKYTTSDIDDTSTLVQLFKLMLDARNAQINQVDFRTTSLGDESGYVTAGDEELQASIDEFLGESDAESSGGDKQEGGDGGSEGGNGEGKKPEKEKPEKEQTEEPPPPPMIDSTSIGQSLSTTMAEDAGDEIKFPIAYPARIVPNSTVSDTETRWFRIDGPNDEIYRGYKYVVSMPTPGGYFGYYGVSGTNWLDAPLFKNASEELEINGRTYKLYYDAGQLRMVAFQKGKAMYWVTNTLDKVLSNAQMLELAKYVAVPGG